MMKPGFYLVTPITDDHGEYGGAFTFTGAMHYSSEHEAVNAGLEMLNSALIVVRVTPLVRFVSAVRPERLS